MTLKENDISPNFSLPSTGDKEFTLSSFKDKNIILYFYPKDDTPGCTKETKEFNELYEEFNKNNTLILGISADGITSHENFKSKYDIKFDLLSDWQKEVVQKYGVWVEKSMFGKKYMGIERSTFIIKKDNVIYKIFRKVKPAGHAKSMLLEIQSLLDS